MVATGGGSVSGITDTASASLWKRLRTAWQREDPEPALPLAAQEAGDAAESVVTDVARHWAVPQGMGQRFVLRNVRVPNGERQRRREVDVVILSRRGVVCLEVKNWSGRVRCGKHKWFQHHGKHVRQARNSSSTSNGSPGVPLLQLQGGVDRPVTAGFGSDVGSLAGRPNADYISYNNPVADIHERAQTLRGFLLRSLEPKVAQIFDIDWSVQGRVVMLGSAEMEAEDDAVSDLSSVVRREGVTAFLCSLNRKRTFCRMLAESSGCRRRSVLQAEELEAACRAVSCLGTWDVVTLMGGRKLKGDLRLVGMFGQVMQAAGGKSRVQQAVFSHPRRRAGRLWQVLWHGAEHCNIHLEPRSGWQGSKVRVPRHASIVFREAGRPQDTSLDAEQVSAIAFSAK